MTPGMKSISSEVFLTGQVNLSSANLFHRQGKRNVRAEKDTIVYLAGSEKEGLLWKASVAFLQVGKMRILAEDGTIVYLTGGEKEGLIWKASIVIL